MWRDASICSNARRNGFRPTTGLEEVCAGGSSHPRPRTFAEANYISSIGLSPPVGGLYVLQHICTILDANRPATRGE